MFVCMVEGGYVNCIVSAVEPVILSTHYTSTNIH